LPVPKNPLKELESLRINVEKPVSEMRKEASETAQRLVAEKLNKT
jgi:hypothetical protein